MLIEKIVYEGRIYGTSLYFLPQFFETYQYSKNITLSFFNFLYIFKKFFGHPHGMWIFPGKGSNPYHNSNPSHSSDNTGSLTLCTTMELGLTGFLNYMKGHQ